MPARLFSRQGELKGTYQVTTGLSVGRDPGNDVVLSATTISGQHARIRWDPDAASFVLEDLGSSTGTRLDGCPVTAAERLGSLHVITFAGAYDFIFQDLGPALEQTPAAARAGASGAAERTIVEGDAVWLPPSLAQRSAPDPPDQVAAATYVEIELPRLPAALAGDRAPQSPPAPRGDRVLEIELKDGGRQRFALRHGDNVIGRSRTATVRLNHSDVSRRHAVIHVEGDRVTVRDEKSANHTFVDDRMVEGEVEVPPGAILRFGRLRGHIAE